MNKFNIPYHLIKSQNKLNFNNNLINMKNFSHKFILFLTNQFKPYYKYHYYKSKLNHVYPEDNRDQVYIIHINYYRQNKFLICIIPNGSTQPPRLIFADNCILINCYKIKLDYRKLQKHHMQNLVNVDCLQPSSHGIHSRLHLGTQHIYYSNIKCFRHKLAHS